MCTFAFEINLNTTTKMLIHKTTGKVYANRKAAIEALGKKTWYIGKHYHEFIYIKEEDIIREKE